MASVSTRQVLESRLSHQRLWVISGQMDMKPKRQSKSLANRSGDRRIISASLTRENCPCLRRFHGARGIQTPPHFAVPAKSPFFPALSPCFPRKSQDVPPDSQRFPPLSRPVPPRAAVPQKSQPFPPSCRLFHGNPSLFHRRASHSPGIPAISAGIPKAPGDSQDVSLEGFMSFQPFHSL